MKCFWILIISGLIFIHSAYSQVKIGDNVSTINTNSLLELETTNKGLVLPRVSLTDVTLPNPLATGLLTGTIVYNTNTTVAGGYGAGIYIWDGSAWTILATPATTNTSAWNIAGNTVSSGNFLGTLNNSSLRFRTNNIQQMVLDSLGSLGLGSSNFGNLAGREKLLVDVGNTTSNTIANFRGNIDNYLQLNLRNTNSGTNASTDFVATADNGNDTSFYIDMGINSSNYTPSVDNFGAANDGYLYTNSRNLLIGTQSSGSDLVFMVSGGSIRNNQAMRISGANGNLIMGRGDNTTTPFGNTIRAANALPAAVNTAGGSLIFVGGKSTGTAAGGDISLTGGATGSGTPGAVNINVGTNNATNINTGVNSNNVTIGNATNNIVLPKFITAGSVFYNGASTGQLSDAVNMIWDNTNNRLGINVTVPSSTLHIIAPSGTSPLILQGVTLGTNTSADSVLTISSGIVKKLPASTFPVAANVWNITGNAGTSAATNFIGTTDAVDLVARTNNIERLRMLSTGNIGINNVSPGSELDVKGTVRLSGTTSGFVGLKGAAAAGATTYTLPAADGTGGQQLSTNGAGVLSWTNQTGATTNTLSLSTNTLTSTINGVAATSSAVSSVVNTSTTNTLVTKVNNVSATGVSIINSNTSSLSGASLTNTINGIASAALDLTPAINSKAWSLSGNAGTTDTINFIGTTDNIPLTIKVNGQRSGRIDHLLNNVFLGYQAGLPNTGSNNVFIGNKAGLANTTGASNTAVGSQAFSVNTTGTEGVAIGVQALNNNTTGTYNTAVGAYAMQGNTIGYSNVAVGYAALQNNIGGSQAVAVGLEALKLATDPGSSTAVGFRSGYSITTGYGNATFGGQSGYSTTTARYNSFFGGEAGYANVLGNENSFYGYYSGRFSTGDFNTFIGSYSGNAVTTGSKNTFLGYSADATGAALTNATAIGYNAKVANSNAMVLGGTGVDAVFVGIGTTAPASELDIKGTLRLGGSTSGFVGFKGAAAAGSATYTWPATAPSSNGQYLSGSTAGVLSWVTPPSNWSLSGNSIASTNFIGSTNAQPLVIKSNNVQVANLNGSTNTVALGVGAVTTANNSTAIGYNARTTQTNTLILGDTVSTTVAIGTTIPNPLSKLDVVGSFDLGADGTLIKNIINYTFTLNVSVPSNPGFADVTLTLPVTLSGTRATVTASPAFDFPGKISIGYARLVTTTTMKIRLINPSSTATVSGDIYFTIVEY